MEVGGEVARIRKDRYVIPEDADLVTGSDPVSRERFRACAWEKRPASRTFSSARRTPSRRCTATASWPGWSRKRRRGRMEARAPGQGAAPRRTGDPHPRARERNDRRHTCNDRAISTLSSPTIPASSTTSMFPAPVPPLSAGIGDKVVAKLDAWPSRHVNPEGHIVEVLGPAGSPGVDMLSIIRKYRLPPEFPARGGTRGGETCRAKSTRRRSGGAWTCATASSSRLTRTTRATFDDAIEVESTPDGWTRRHPHCGRLALRRPEEQTGPRGGLTRQQRLSRRPRDSHAPEALSNRLCSLRPNEDHLTFSVFAGINRKGKAPFRALRENRDTKRRASHLQGGLRPSCNVRRTTRSAANSTSPGNWPRSCAANASQPVRSISSFPRSRSGWIHRENLFVWKKSKMTSRTSSSRS